MMSSAKMMRVMMVSVVCLMGWSAPVSAQSRCGKASTIVERQRCLDRLASPRTAPSAPLNVGIVLGLGLSNGFITTRQPEFELFGEVVGGDFRYFPRVAKPVLTLGIVLGQPESTARFYLGGALSQTGFERVEGGPSIGLLFGRLGVGLASHHDFDGAHGAGLTLSYMFTSNGVN